MKKRIFVINSLLIVILFFLLTIPVLINQTFVQNSENSENVYGTRTVTNKDLVIIPNSSDFNGYAQFSSQTFIDGILRDEISLTAFPGQVATYRNLYSLYNATQKDIALKIDLTGFNPSHNPLIKNIQGYILQNGEKVYFTSNTPLSYTLKKGRRGYLTLELDTDPQLKANSRISLPLTLTANFTQD